MTANITALAAGIPAGKTLDVNGYIVDQSNWLGRQIERCMRGEGKRLKSAVENFGKDLQEYLAETQPGDTTRVMTATCAFNNVNAYLKNKGYDPFVVEVEIPLATNQKQRVVFIYMSVVKDVSDDTTVNPKHPPAQEGSPEAKLPATKAEVDASLAKATLSTTSALANSSQDASSETPAQVATSKAESSAKPSQEDTSRATPPQTPDQGGAPQTAPGAPMKKPRGERISADKRALNEARDQKLGAVNETRTRTPTKKLNFT